MAAFHSTLPDRPLLHIQPHHLLALDGLFTADGLQEMLRMGCQAEGFTPAPAHEHKVERLTHRHTGEIIDLYHFYPDNFFEPAQLGTGHYYGIRVDDQLVSVAGVHILGRSSGVAVLGNIVTHPDFRMRGLSTACTSYLCEQLLREGSQVLALNVQRNNHSAVAVYEKLGFRYHDTYIEGFVTRLTVLRTAS